MAKRVPIRWHGWVVLLPSVAAALSAADLPVGRQVDIFGDDLLMATVPRAAAARDDVAVVGIDDDAPFPTAITGKSRGHTEGIPARLSCESA